MILLLYMETKGGCCNRERTVNKFYYKNRTVKLISPKSSCDNCLFMCFVHALELKGNKLKFDEIRKELNIGSGHIHYLDTIKIADYFKTGFIMLNEKQEVILYKNLEEG